jgi:hypothetical protein
MLQLLSPAVAAHRNYDPEKDGGGCQADEGEDTCDGTGLSEES